MSDYITMNTFTDKRVLNIFTDASIYENGDEYISSHGFYSPTTNESHVKIVRSSSNNKGELMGIRDALMYGLSKRNEYLQVNIWSDSLYSVKSICEWFPSWWFNAYDGVLRNSSGQPVQNQDLLRVIVDLILTNNFRVNLIHQRGHINEKVSIKDAIYSFRIANKINIDSEAMKNAAICNQIIDEMTRNQFMKSNVLEIPVYTNPIRFSFLRYIDINRYLILTRKTGDIDF